MDYRDEVPNLEGVVTLNFVLVDEPTVYELDTSMPPEVVVRHAVEMLLRQGEDPESAKIAVDWLNENVFLGDKNGDELYPTPRKR